MAQAKISKNQIWLNHSPSVVRHSKTGALKRRLSWDHEMAFLREKPTGATLELL